jgi:hypothetical protein
MQLAGHMIENASRGPDHPRTMESAPVRGLPAGSGWLCEPKWDGFRCLAFRDAGAIDLRSRNSKPMARYFPEVAALPVTRFVLDRELIIRNADDPRRPCRDSGFALAPPPLLDSGRGSARTTESPARF